MSSSSAERPTPSGTVAFPSEGAAEEKHFTPRLMVALVGSLVGFIFLIVAFHLVSRRNWCVGRHDRLPQYAAHHGAPTAPAPRARRRLCPLRRLKAREGAEAGVTRIPPPSAPPSYAHALSTPAVRTAVICEPRPLAWQRLLRFGTSPSAARGVWSGVPVPVTATPMPTPTPGFPPPPYTALPPRTAVAAFHRDRR